MAATRGQAVWRALVGACAALGYTEPERVSASGGTPAATPQIFTRPSGKGPYVTDPGETSLDDTFRDTRVALSGNHMWQFGRARKWTLGLYTSTEHDYASLGANTSIAREFDRQNTTVVLRVCYFLVIGDVCLGPARSSDPRITSKIDERFMTASWIERGEPQPPGGAPGAGPSRSAPSVASLLDILGGRPGTVAIAGVVARTEAGRVADGVVILRYGRHGHAENQHEADQEEGSDHVASSWYGGMIQGLRNPAAAVGSDREERFQ